MQDDDSATVFTDNDGLAARLAHELKAELVVLMTDVDGVFTGPPLKPDSKKIDVWCPEIYEDIVLLGEKSAHGRGGMGSKIKAAWCARLGRFAAVLVSRARARQRCHAYVTFGTHSLLLCPSTATAHPCVPLTVPSPAGPPAQGVVSEVL
jgi:glutamate 5-kinase